MNLFQHLASTLMFQHISLAYLKPYILHLLIALCFGFLYTIEHVMQFMGCPPMVYVFCHAPYINLVWFIYLIITAILVISCFKLLLRFVKRFFQ
jgi:hypothetical protein